MTYDRPTAGLRLSELEELELTIEKLVAGGDGLGRFEGIPIFVPRSAPGDRVRVRLFERRPDYGRAEILELLAAGPGRREPPCPYFARCGGCDLQHLDDAAQTRLKARGAARDAAADLRHRRCPTPSAVVAGQAWGYRLRTQLHTARRARRLRGRLLRPPQPRPGRRRDLSGARAAAREGARDARPAAAGARALADRSRLRRRRAGLLRPARRRAAARRAQAHGSDRSNTASTPGASFRAMPGCSRSWSRSSSDRRPAERAADLYGGVGLFALPLARRYGRVVMVEGDRPRRGSPPRGVAARRSGRDPRGSVPPPCRARRDRRSSRTRVSRIPGGSRRRGRDERRSRGRRCSSGPTTRPGGTGTGRLRRG